AAAPAHSRPGFNPRPARAPSSKWPVLDAMQEAVAQGARLLACSEALHAQGIDRQALIAECSGQGGAVQFMARAADLRWRTLVF
ncbi:MAG: hypothetical protein KA141_11325, partial [Rubrivivax sp.]|nr:hypothetical protein [Rubrivivax sp.]